MISRPGRRVDMVRVPKQWDICRLELGCPRWFSLIILFLGIGSVLLFSGCGGSLSSGPPESVPPATSQPPAHPAPSPPPPLRLTGAYPLDRSPWNGAELVFYFDREVMAVPGASGQASPVSLEPTELNEAMTWQVEDHVLRIRFADSDLPQCFSRLDVRLGEDLQARDGGRLPESDRHRTFYIHDPVPLGIAEGPEELETVCRVVLRAPMAAGTWESQYDLTVTDSRGAALEPSVAAEPGQGRLTLTIPLEQTAWPVRAAFTPKDTADEWIKLLGTRGLVLNRPSEAAPEDRTAAPSSQGVETGTDHSAPSVEDARPPVYPAFTLSGGDYWQERGGDGASLYFYTEVPVDRRDLESRLVVTPPVDNLRIEYANSGFSIHGDWITGMRYRIQIGSGLRSADGFRSMTGRFEMTTAKVPQVRGLTILNSDKNYLPVHPLRPLKLAARNLDSVQVILWRVFPSNLREFTDALLGNELGRWEVEKYAEELARHEVRFPSQPDRKVEAELDPAALLPDDQRGVFVLTVENQPGLFQWRAYPFVWTGIGLLAHHAGKDVAVTAHRLDTLEPLADASVTLVSSKRLELGTVRTDADGMARFTLPDFRRGTPAIVWVTTDADAAFLALRGSPSEETVRGIRPEALDLDQFDADGYDGYVYCDRNLYRPGETVHARFLVRQRYTEPASGVVLQARLRDPRCSELSAWPVTLSEWGTGGLDLETRTTWLTGRYTLELTAPGASKTTASTVFNLEAFVPNRIRVAVETDRAFTGPAEPVIITCRSEMMYGGPAVGYAADARVILTPGKWTPEQWPGFRFCNDARMKPVVKQLGRAMTGPDGTAQFTFSAADTAGMSAPMEAVARVAVSEPGGRDVVARKFFTVLPAEPALGLLAEPLQERPAVRVRVAAVNQDGTPAGLSGAVAAIESERWHYSVRRMDNGYTIQAEPYYVTLETREIPLQQGTGETEFSLADLWGRLRVRVYAAATPLYATTVLFAGWGRVTLADDNRPALVDVSTDRDRYEPGDTCMLTIRAPFDGIAFVALQQDRMLETWRCPIGQGEGRLAIPVQEAYFPNAWALVTVVRSTTATPATGVPLAVFGTANIRVTRPDRKIVVTLPDVPPEIRAEQPLNLTVEARDAAGQPIPAEITVAAVDQGIHDILGYEDPDPFSWFERPRKPPFGRSDFYDRVAVDAWLTEAVGGDALERRLGGVPAIGDNWIRPVALWSGVLRAGPDGRVTASFQVPNYVGRLRVAAVATAGDRTGSAAADVLVRNPYLLRLTVPRFVRTGDTFDAVARLVNTTESPCHVTLSWTASGGLKGGGSLTAEPAPGGEAIERARFETLSQEPGSIRWTAEFRDPVTGAAETLTEETRITAGPSGLWRKEAALREVLPGEQAVLDTGGFEDAEDFTLTVIASASPLLPLMDRLMSLIEYPYGCTEQAVSRAFPLLTLAGLLRDFFTGTDQDLLWTEDRVREALAEVSRQIAGAMLPSGGVAMWPGDVTQNTLCTVYASHFLSLALDAGLTTFDEAAWKALRGQLWAIARGENLNEDGLTAELFLRAYATYVLSLQPEPGVLELAWQLERAPLPESARMLLTAVVGRLTGDTERAKAYRTAMSPVRVTDQQEGGALMSPRREIALSLLAGCAIALPQSELDGLAEAARYTLTRADRLTTQDAAFLCAALCAWHQIRGGDVGQAAGFLALADGKKSISGSTAATASVRGPGARITVNNTGAVPLWVRVTREGMSAGGIQTGYSEGGLRMEHEWMLPGAQPVPSDADLIQGESYVGRLTLSSRRVRRNIVVSIPLPAGVEPLNPRLDPDALAAMGFGLPGDNAEDTGRIRDGGENKRPPDDDILVPSHTEIRDDRLILVFDEIPAGTRRCHYLMRAVTAGTFSQPGMVAEAMYAPDVRAGLPGLTVTVKTP